MPEYNFAIEGAHAAEQAVVPTFTINLRFTNLAPGRLQNVLLQSKKELPHLHCRDPPDENSWSGDPFSTSECWVKDSARTSSISDRQHIFVLAADIPIRSFAISDCRQNL